MSYNSDQSMYNASVSFSDNSDDFMPDTWEVYACRKDSHGIPATYNCGTFWTEAEALELVAQINS